ncbi:MAG TPA: dihydropteroate synthase [Acidimicrobiia bacterium]|nr:dihydropteroate synthase [Acidimicrobiia bacterium]
MIDIRSGVVVGVVNVTPDSFSDGGEFLERRKAIGRGVEMMGQGADLIDVGGESTRPGAEPVPEAEELRRLMPVVDGLVAEGVPVSIDTYKPGVARRALDSGASVVNDVTGFRNPEMVETVAGSECGVVAMHMQGTPLDMHLDPSYEDVVEEVRSYLVETATKLAGAGIARERIAIDPGIGFGKRGAHSLALLARLDVLAETGLPVMVGTSRKGFLGRIVEADDRDSLDRATAVTTALAYTLGARLFRVHDVPKTRDALRVAGAIVTNQ